MSSIATSSAPELTSPITTMEPVDSTFPYYTQVYEKDDLPQIVFAQIEHFFTHYKDLEKEKWVRFGTWGGAAEAKQVVLEAIERAKAAEAA